MLLSPLQIVAFLKQRANENNESNLVASHTEAINSADAPN